MILALTASILCRADTDGRSARMTNILDTPPFTILRIRSYTELSGVSLKRTPCGRTIKQVGVAAWCRPPTMRQGSEYAHSRVVCFLTYPCKAPDVWPHGHYTGLIGRRLSLPTTHASHHRGTLRFSGSIVSQSDHEETPHA
jgi:hypothetical protein